MPGHHPTLSFILYSGLFIWIQCLKWQDFGSKSNSREFSQFWCDFQRDLTVNKQHGDHLCQQNDIFGNSVDVLNHKDKRTRRNYLSSTTRYAARYSLLLLLLGGDIEQNPGPNYKYPCGNCFKPVTKHRDRRGRGIQCDICDTWFHCHCIGMSLSTYRLHMDNDQLEFHCQYCSLPQLSDSFFEPQEDNNSGSGEIPPVSDRRKAILTGQTTYQNSDGLKICHINTGQGGLLCHFDSVKDFVSDYKPDVLCLTETWLNKDTSDDTIQLDGYNIDRRDNNNTFQGEQGVIIYIKDNIPFKPRTDLNFEHLMNTCIEVVIPHTKQNILITCIYRHPNSNVKFFDHFEILLGALDNEKCKSVVTGDFNIDVFKAGSTNCIKLSNLFKDYDFKQHINCPTRLTDNSETCIDLTITNYKENVVAGVTSAIVADHQMNFIILGKRNTNNKHVFINTRNLKNVNVDKLNEELSNMPWNVIDVFDDINDCYLAWDTLFSIVINKFAPERRVRTGKNKKVKIDNEEANALRSLRDQYHKLFITTNNPKYYNIYKKVRNRYTNCIRYFKKLMFSNRISDNQGNSKGMWKVLRFLLPGKNKSTISALEVNGETISSRSEIANIFNKYFVDVGKNLASQIPNINIDPLHYVKKYLQKLAVNGFSFTLINNEDMCKLFNNLPLNKATGLDGYQARLLKMCAPGITSSLTYLFNKSLKLGQFPDKFKQARITPIFKSKSKLDPGNYRPVSVLPILSKFLERIVHNQVYAYLTDNNLLTVCQSGFRTKHSTVSSLIRFTDFCFEQIDKGNYIGMVALDLRKAFDTVNHQILLSKLKLYGFDDTCLSWFNSYLSNRTQLVSINDTLSNTEFVTCGVPQGSILGPLLFILYINDLTACAKYCDINMFADDTMFYYAAKNIDLVKSNLQTDLVNISEWLCANKLSLHIGKTNCMVVGSVKKVKDKNHELNLMLNNENVEQTDNVKYLGVHLDENLKFDEHVDKLVGKINRGLGILKRSSFVVEKDSLLTIYNTIILPHFDYCAVVWGSCNDTLITRLQRLQNRAMRIILKCPFRTHISTMLNDLNWMCLRQRIFYLQCVWMWKVNHGLVPEYLSSKFKTNSSYSTRFSNSNNYFVEICNHKSFKYTGTRAWNSLPPKIKSLENIDSFKSEVVKFILGAKT